MLAPLENRALIEREPDDALRAAELEKENAGLRQALRQARSSQKRMITMHANRNSELGQRIAALEQHCAEQAARISAFESGQAIIELGRQLMELKEANARLVESAQRVWHLDKTICAAHRECERLARECDSLALRLCTQAADTLN